MDCVRRITSIYFSSLWWIVHWRIQIQAPGAQSMNCLGNELYNFSLFTGVYMSGEIRCISGVKAFGDSGSGTLFELDWVFVRLFEKSLNWFPFDGGTYFFMEVVFSEPHYYTFQFEINNFSSSSFCELILYRYAMCKAVTISGCVFNARVHMRAFLA